MTVVVNEWGKVQVLYDQRLLLGGSTVQLHTKKSLHFFFLHFYRNKQTEHNMIAAGESTPSSPTSLQKDSSIASTTGLSDDDVSVLSEDNVSLADDDEGPMSNDDDMSVGGDSFDGESMDGGRSFGGKTKCSVDTDDEDFGAGAADLFERVQNYLADFDGPLLNDPEMACLQEALAEAQKSLQDAKEKSEDDENERAADLAEAKNRVKATKRRNKERLKDIEGSEVLGRTARQKRRQVSARDDDDLDRSGHEIDEIIKRFQEQKERVLRKHKKQDKLAMEMKMGARRSLRRLRMVEVKARLSREEAEKAAKVKEEAEKPLLDMSEEGRRSRVFNFYMRFGMPKKETFIASIAKMDPQCGTSVEDVNLLPWDRRELRVNVTKLNQVLMGLGKPDW